MKPLIYRTPCTTPPAPPALGYLLCGFEGTWGKRGAAPLEWGAAHRRRCGGLDGAIRRYTLKLGSRSPGGEGVPCILRPFGIEVVVSMLKWSLFMSRWQLRNFFAKLRNSRPVKTLFEVDDHQVNKSSETNGGARGRHESHSAARGVRVARSLSRHGRAVERRPWKVLKPPDLLKHLRRRT